jgi:hypothetical protein
MIQLPVYGDTCICSKAFNAVAASVPPHRWIHRKSNAAAVAG